MSRTERPFSLPRAMLVEARPRQWTKNLLVAAAPAAAGALFEPEVAIRTLAAFIVFCLAASGTYYLNDAMDAEADRLHPRKRDRPVAAGLIPVGTAFGMSGVLLGTGVVLAALLGPPALTAAVMVYVALTVAYSLGLKQLPIVELMVVAAGFVIRAAAGGFATGVPLSDWFLIVASFGALFIVTGKRHAEVVAMGEAGASHRAVLASYPPDFTRHVLGISSAIALVAYCLWAFEAEPGPGRPWVMLSIIPFLGIMLRYAMLVSAGHGGEPEEIVMSDRALQVAGAVWVALLGLGIALAGGP